MPSSGGRDMLDRAAVVHRWDCPALAAEAALPEPGVADIDTAPPPRSDALTTPCAG
jgi:hypothetical protein